MKALILAAGYATRLYPLTKNKAKPLLPINGKPIINYILERLETVKEIDKVFVVTNDKFYIDFLDWKSLAYFRKEIEVINDGTLEDQEKLGAIGDIDFVINSRQIKDDLLIIAGDNLFNFNIVDFVQKSYNMKPSVSMGVYDLKDKRLAGLYGIVKLNGQNRIVDFEEKPRLPKSSLAAAGIYLIPESAIELVASYLKEGNSPDQPGHFISWLYKVNKVYGFQLAGDWFDIGSLECYKKADELYKEKKSD
ncbi:MAG: nucleotidyltransferase family protein [Candidatus Omnitrophica bacterium]|nr:nucleotidyltransferase family protein [Candidatus Omnitrophota bacterium]